MDTQMTQPRFIQIHSLHTYPAALINRDDAGLAKRLPLGNTTRTRISSQCLKRHWRIADDPFALSMLKVPMAIRTRGALERIRGLIMEQDISEPLAQAAAEALRDGGLVDKAGKAIKGEDALKTGQAVLMGKAEMDYLANRCVTLAQAHPTETTLKAAVLKLLKDEKANIQALKHGSGLESALFGRMVTSDVLASRDAAVYVAHSFTVHAAQVENDYFTVVDDLLQEAGEISSAGIFDTELASGLYYSYVVVDVRQLFANLEGEDFQACFADTTAPEQRALTAKVVEHLLHLIATVSPGAKRGSTAPFDWAKFLLVEAGDWQPRSLASAFHDALPLADRDERPIRQRAIARLHDEIARMDDAYGAPLARRFMALDPVAIPLAQRLNLNDLATWTAQVIMTGVC
jgi:CRISPR system Cascade subunit CasC